MASKEEVLFSVKADLQGFRKSMDQLKKMAQDSAKKVEQAMEMNLTDEGSRAGRTFSNGISSQMKGVTNTIKNELGRIAQNASEIEIDASLSDSAISNIKKQLSNIEGNITTSVQRASASMSNNANAPNTSAPSTGSTVMNAANLGAAVTVANSVRAATAGVARDITELTDLSLEKLRKKLDQLKAKETRLQLRIDMTQGERALEALNKALDDTIIQIAEVEEAIRTIEQRAANTANASGRAFAVLGAKIRPVINQIKSFFRSKWQASNLRSAITGIGTLFQSLKTRVGSLANSIKTKFQQIGSSNAITNLKNKFKGLMDSIKNTSIFQRAANGIRSTGDAANGASKKVGKLSSGFKGLIKKLITFFGLYQMATWIKEGTKDAMQYEAAVMNMQRTLGIASESFMDFANNNAIAFGVSKKQAVEYGNIFSVLLFDANKQLAKTGESMDDIAAKTADMSQEIVESAGIIAGALGYDVNQVLDGLRSGLLGSSEAVDQYGLSMKIAALEQSETFRQVANGASSWNDLTTAQQQYIIAQEIVNQTQRKYGGIVQNTASMHNQFIAQLANTKLALGNVGKAIWTAVLPALTKLMAWLEVAFNYIAKVMSAILGLFGITVSFSGGGGTSGALSGLSSGLDDVGSSAGGAGDALDNAGKAAKNAGSGAKKAAEDTKKAAKEIKRALAGFDQINVLSLPKDSDSSSGSGSGSGSGGSGGGSGSGGSGGGAGGGAGDLNNALTDVTTSVNTELSGLASKFVDWIKSIDFGPLLESFNRLKESIKPIIETCGKLIMWFLESVLGPLAKWTIEEVIPRFFDTLAYVLDILAPILDVAVDAFITFNDAVLIPIAKWVADKFIETWDAINDVLERFGNWLNGDGAWCAELLGTIAGSFAIVAEVVLIAIGVFKTVSAVFNGIKTAVGLVSSAFTFLTSPIGLVVAAIVALVAIVVVCIKYWDEIKAAGTNCWDHLSDSVKLAIIGIKDIIGSLIDFVKNIFGDIIDIIAGIFTGDGQKVGEAVRNLIGHILEALWGILVGIAELGIALIEIGIQLIAGLMKGIWEGIKLIPTVLVELFNFVIDFFKGLFGINSPSTVFAELGGFLIDGLIQGVQNAWEGIKNAFKVIVDWVSDIFKKAWDNVKKAWNNATDFFKGIWNGIKNVFSTIGTWFKDKFTSAWNNIKSAWSSVKTWFKDKWTGIKDTFSSVGTWFKDKFTSAWSNVKNAWSGAKSWFSDKWGSIKGVFSNVGGWFSDKFSSVKDKVSSPFTKAKSTIETTFNKIKHTIKSAIEKVKGYFKFSWSLPKPKIPKFSVSGGKAPWGLMGQGSLPKISIKWNKDGGIMTRAMLFGATGNTLLGGGEAGHEAILPLDKLWSQLDNQFDRQNAILSNAVATGAGANSGPVNITLKINDLEMGKAVINSLKALSEHSGGIDLPL